MSLRPVLRDLGVLLHAPAVMALGSVPVALAWGETWAVTAFAVTAAACLVPGQALYWAFRRTEEMQLRHAMVTVVLAWTLVGVLCALPYLLVARGVSAVDSPGTLAAFAHPSNALFEAVSGITGTGLTVALNPAELPRCLQWWRSLTEWVGGVGIIVLMLAVFHHTAEAGRLLYSEARERKVLPDVAGTVRATWWVYALYTAIGIVALRGAGMPWWDAVNHALTGISTGGFTVTPDSLAGYGRSAQGVMVLLMAAGAVSFAVHYRVLVHGEVGRLWKDAESRALLVLLGGGGLALGVENALDGTGGWMDSAFQWASGLCTAGFQTVRLEEWRAGAHVLLVGAMLVGGCAGATTGGLKLRRVLWLGQAVLTRVGRVSVHPWILMEHRAIVDGKGEPASGPHVEAAAVIAALWGLTVLAGTLLLMHAVPEAPLNTVLFEVTSALGNVGLSAGVTHPELGGVAKAGLMLLMWMGRLEILPVLVLFLSFVPRHAARR